jgi:hypothetical protein
MIATQFVLRARALAVPGLLVGLCLAAGCGRPPKHADPDEAPKALRTVLDAWKGGQTREAFSRESPIRIADSRWDGGYKLLEYEIGPVETHGYTLSFQVTLRMKDAKGKKQLEKATYAVATSPLVAVRRVEDM